jgi:hypothetical protein
MKHRSVLVFGPGFGVASTLSAQTATELAQYILGLYENVHQSIEVKYPAGKADFLADILCDGYHECERVSSWNGIAEVVSVDFDEMEPTPADKLDHASFHDTSAYRLIIKKFAESL